ncbi:hypothetical protein RMSM_00192 [Rhodopirellula maiorica SM1]|uniref:BON domain-containing protein n=1 Tax=Rhodopirellula maiorica SM1 TaxID=1265738 RepID=M5S5E3_9BACT|nr:BON domain-containing protein [Rhodopirellula maiorica]EMI22862.1 hypothetical protein RMSM_00192 [Rhodopirellula maiorica SM1]
MNRNLQSIEFRVKSSLTRVGCVDLIVTDFGDGDVEIAGHVDSYNDRVLAITVTRALPGVRRITDSMRH